MSFDPHCRGISDTAMRGGGPPGPPPDGAVDGEAAIWKFELSLKGKKFNEWKSGTLNQEKKWQRRCQKGRRALAPVAAGAGGILGASASRRRTQSPSLRSGRPCSWAMIALHCRHAAGFRGGGDGEPVGSSGTEGNPFCRQCMRGAHFKVSTLMHIF